MVQGTGWYSQRNISNRIGSQCLSGNSGCIMVVILIVIVVVTVWVVMVFVKW